MSPKILFISISPVFCGSVLFQGYLTSGSQNGCVYAWTTHSPIHICWQRYHSKNEETLSPKVSSNASLKFIGMNQSVWPGGMNGLLHFPMSYTSPRELILNGQPMPRACRKGKGAWCWECNPQKSTVVALGISVRLQLINYSSPTSQKQCTWWQ